MSEPELPFRGHARQRWLTERACFLAQRGLAELSIVQTVEEESKLRCDPPPTVDEIAAIVKPTILIRSGAWRQLPSRPRDERAVRFRLLSDVELENLPPQQWLLEGLMPLGSVVVLLGAPNVGKTFLALAWALCIALGRSWLGRSVIQGPVVYVAAEGVRGFRVRVLAWKQVNDSGPIDDARFIGEPVRLINEDDVQGLMDLLRQMPRAPVLVVFDTLSRCMAGGDENSSKDMGVIVYAADCICKELGSTALLLHHPGRKGSSERGHSLLRGAADTMMLLDAPGDASIKVLTCEKQKDAEAFAPIAMSFNPVDLPDGGRSLVVEPAPELDPWTATAPTESESKALKRFSDSPCTRWTTVVLLRAPMQEDRCAHIRWTYESGRCSIAMPR